MVKKLKGKSAESCKSLLSRLQALKHKASSTEDSIKVILLHLDEIKSKLCSSEQSLLQCTQETSIASVRLNSQEPVPPHVTKEASHPKEICLESQ